jgi:hypothetical protein
MARDTRARRDDDDATTDLKIQTIVDPSIATRRPTLSSLKSWLPVLHHLLRVVGCDVGYNSLLMFRRLFPHYKMKSWWTENLDLAIVLADITVQTNQPKYAVYLHLARDVSEALGSVTCMGRL